MIQAAEHVRFLIDHPVLIELIPAPSSGDDIRMACLQFRKPALGGERFQGVGNRLASRCGSEMNCLQEKRENAPYPSPAFLQLLIVHVIRRTNERINLAES